MKVDFAHPFTITKLSVLHHYMRENKKDVAKEYIPQILFSGTVSFFLTPARFLEWALYAKQASRSEVKRPLFIVGHWRGGTTLLQQLLARDPQFGFLDPLMNFTFSFYHILGWAFRSVIASNLDMGRPMDNMKYAMDLPLEEYIVFATVAPNGVYPLNFFPQAFLKYNRMAFIDRMPPKQRARWIKDYDGLLKKLTALNNGKSLLLKSPDNTARVKALKELYPDAKFVNIYRDPYEVIRSTVHLYQKMLPTWTVEKLPDEETLEDWIIEVFREMYETFFEEQKVLGPDSFYEIRFEDFEKDPLPILEDMYGALGLGDFSLAEPGIRRQWESQAGYRKNTFDYPERLVKKVNDRLDFYFTHYGYKKRTV